jgi:centromere protein S
MAPLPIDDRGKEERLKAALWYSVGQTIDAIGLAHDINASPHFIGAMSEMLWSQIGMYAQQRLEGQ